MIITIPVTQQMKEIAAERGEHLGVLNRSITNGGGNYAGGLGEVAVEQYLGATWVGDYDYDSVYLGMKLEVKSKRTGRFPQADYECSVSYTNPDQKCDLYVFTRVHNDCDFVYLLGFITPEDFKKVRFLVYAGVTSGNNNFVEKETCYKCYVHDLTSLHKVKS